MLLFNDYFWSGFRLKFSSSIFVLHKINKIELFFCWIIQESKSINIVFVASSVGVGRLGTDRTEIEFDEMVLVFYYKILLLLFFLLSLFFVVSIRNKFSIK